MTAARASLYARFRPVAGMEGARPSPDRRQSRSPTIQTAVFLAAIRPASDTCVDARSADVSSTTALEDEFGVRAECWCCGCIVNPERMVSLGNHPEVMICTRCAHSVSKWAWEIDDRTKTGPRVRARALLRQARTTVMNRGWQNSPLIGRPLRWVGQRFLP